MANDFPYNFITGTIFVIFAVLIVCYLICKLTRGWCKTNTCLVGKTAIVTGGNSGIGYETVLGLAARGCKVIIADVVNSDKSRKEIISETGNENIISMHLDLGEFASIRKFAKEFQAQPDARLDILINNAGIAQAHRKKSKDGECLTMQVNYFGPFLLTHVLGDVLKSTKDSRVIFISSLIAFLQNMAAKNLTKPSENLNYSKSKLSLLIASDYFSEKFKSYNVTSNCTHPGLVNTKIHHSIAYVYIFHLLPMFLVYLLGKTPFEGAQTTLDAATSQKWNGVTNKFLWDCISCFKPIQYYNRDYRAAVIKKTKEVVGLKEWEEL